MVSNPDNQSFIEEFREQSVLFWTRLPHKLFFLSLFAVWMVLFNFLGHRMFNFTSNPSLFSWMWGAYSSESLDSGHGKLIPLVVLVLLWLKREQLLKLAQNLWWLGLVGVICSLSLHLFGYMLQQPRLSILAFFGGVLSLLGLVWGWRFMKECFFPFAFFIFSIPFGNTVDQLTFPLRLLATKVSWLVTHGILGIPLVQQGTQLLNADQGYSYEVAAACSGIRSLIPLIIITSIYGFLNFQTKGRRMLMVVSAVPLALICNVIRLIALIVARHFFGEGAGHFVHEWFGFVTYAIALAGVFLLGRWLEEKENNPSLKGKLA